MLATFNCGIGMVVVAPPGQAEAAARPFTEAGDTVVPLGRLVARDGGQAMRYRGEWRR
jgi:phosphoribosylformylglycinamidine cyclo-ligase